MTTLEAFRQEKDEFFWTAPQSPLTPEQKQQFHGLSYFPEAPDLTLEVIVEPFAKQDEVRMQTSSGEAQTYHRYGRFEFDVDGEVAALTIYTDRHGYFLPFVDSLAGSETYGAGRYLEPQPLGKGKFLVDFNYAYNPYCAYNERWSCPMTPRENRLSVAVRAGEKVFLHS